MKKSVWTEGITLSKFNSLDKDLKTDVLIIGGGLCGLLCGYYLGKAGVNYVVVEGNQIASGITKNTTAKITSQHGLIYTKILKSYSENHAQMYLGANQDALAEYARLCKNIDCDFERRDAFTYTLKNRGKIEEEVKTVNSLGFDAEFTRKTELPFDMKGAIVFKDQAQFNPLKFISAISQDMTVYENTFVQELTPTKAVTNCGSIKAKKIIVATHFPFINKHGSYFLKLYQHRSYVSAYENAADIQGMYVDEDKKGMSFRNYNNLLLIGGGGHRTGKDGGAWNETDTFAKKYYPRARLTHQWAAQDCMSLDGIPYIGRYSRNTPEMFVATGFNKWGITSSMVAAKILCDMVMEKKNDFEEVFSPQRTMVKSQLILNGLESAKNLLTPTTKRCPHLGCALKWNKAEHTWDCPCHGSRFDEKGKLIDNPATGDADLS